MGVDIQQHRAAIGSFIQKGYFSCKQMRKHQNFKPRSNKMFFNIIKLLLITCITFLALAEPNNLYEASVTISIAETHSLSTITCAGEINGGVSLNRNRVFIFTESSNRVQYYRFANLDNKYSKYTNGNRKHSGIRIYHFNKGNSHLNNRMHEIENIISSHRPHVLGISEANFFHNHDLDSVQIENYTFKQQKLSKIHS